MFHDIRNIRKGTGFVKIIIPTGILQLGGAEISCYVLENGERILSTRGVMQALGRSWRGRKYSGTEYPVFLEAKNLKPFISDEIDAVPMLQTFITDKGKTNEGSLPYIAYLFREELYGYTTAPFSSQKPTF